MARARGDLLAVRLALFVVPQRSLPAMHVPVWSGRSRFLCCGLGPAQAQRLRYNLYCAGQCLFSGAWRQLLRHCACIGVFLVAAWAFRAPAVFCCLRVLARGGLLRQFHHISLLLFAYCGSSVLFFFLAACIYSIRGYIEGVSAAVQSHGLAVAVVI